MGLLSFKKNRFNHLKFKAKTSKAAVVKNQTLSDKQSKTESATNDTAASTAATSPTPKIPSDVPLNVKINVPQARSRGLSRGKASTRQWSTFSLVSMPSMRGISERLENPHLWEYGDDERDIYANYDVNEEIKEETDCSNNSDEFSYCNYHKGNSFLSTPSDEKTVEEEPFFAGNPLPGMTPSPMQKKRLVSSRVQQHQQKQHQQRGASVPASVTDLPVGDPSFSKPDVTRQLIKKYFSDLWNRGELEVIPEVCSPKIRLNINNDSFDKVGHDGLARLVNGVRDLFDDYHCEIHSIVVEGNKAFCRLRFSGKHVAPLFGYPPTGLRVSWMGSQEFTCVNGKILKVWELADMLTLQELLQANAMKEALGSGQEVPHY
jgi:predicted ester cyclase